MGKIELVGDLILDGEVATEESEVELVVEEREEKLSSHVYYNK